MKSVGVDIEDISRFENKSNAFLEKIFTKNELEYCLSQKKYQENLCARFCAKEAVIKALSTLNKKKPAFLDIEIIKKTNGAPYVNMLASEFKKYNYYLSLSHEKDKAIAFVVVE